MTDLYQHEGVRRDHFSQVRLFECWSCEFSIVSERMVLICPECDSETSIAPHSKLLRKTASDA